MTTAFPSGLDNLTKPQGSLSGGTDKLSTTGVIHGQLHQNEIDAIQALEAKVGVDSSAVTTSLDYLLKNTASLNPGHKHDFTSIADIATARILGRNTAGTGNIEQLTASTVKTMLGYQIGVATDEVKISQSISSLATFTQNISLSNSDWTNGVLIAKDTSTGSNAYSLIHFTDTVAQSAGIGAAAGYSSYIGGNFQVGGGINQTDGRVTSPTGFMGGGNQFPAVIGINSVRISGSNLEIIWKNNAATTQTISAKIRYYLMRGDKVTP